MTWEGELQLTTQGTGGVLNKALCFYCYYYCHYNNYYHLFVEIFQSVLVPGKE